MDIILALALLVSPVDHGSDGHDRHTEETAAQSIVAADVRTVDTGARTALLRHEAMPELGMPSMVMEFVIADDVDIALFAPGEALMITATRDEDGLTVIAAEPETAE
jgi:Cu/Ag efflux protein CusF